MSLTNTVCNPSSDRKNIVIFAQPIVASNAVTKKGIFALNRSVKRNNGFSSSLDLHIVHLLSYAKNL